MRQIQYKIKDLGRVITGKTPPTSKKEMFGSKYPFITPSDIKSFDIRYIQKLQRYLSEEGYNYQKQLLIPPNSICMVCIGSTVSKICMSKDYSFTNQQINTIIPDLNIVDKFFLFYTLRYNAPIIKNIANGRGSGKPIINKTGFENLEINLPSLEYQHKVGQFLANYDNLIENLECQIEILEELIQKLFLEWFINFNFNPKVSSQIIETELGQIPKDWNINSISEISDIILGGTPKRKIPEYWNGDVKWAAAKDISNNLSFYIIETKECITQEGLNKSNAKLLPLDSIIITARGTVGKMCLVGEPMSCNQTCYAIIPKSPSLKYYLYLYLKNILNKIISLSYGAVFDTITMKTFDELKIYIPNTNILINFNSIINPLFRKIFLNSKKLNILKKLRDLMIPLLITESVKI